MKVSDILRIKGHTLFTTTPHQPLMDAVCAMSDRDIGSLVVLDQGRLAGMLTFREVMDALVQQQGSLGQASVKDAMVTQPLTCTPETELDEVRRMMLDCHARYMPVVENGALAGVISFYDVAKTVVDSQNFENKMLKAYIRDWPDGQEPPAS
jgi:CBS domain-containing protein